MALKSLILAIFLALSASAAAEDNCPTGWLPNSFKQERCCPGGMVVDDEGAYCCVQDMRFYKEVLTNSALLYENATTTSDSGMEWTTQKDVNPCYATVRFSASDYSARVSTALSEAEATPTDRSSSAATTASSTMLSGGRSTAGLGTATPTVNPTESSSAAVLRGPTKKALVGGVALAAGAFML